MMILRSDQHRELATKLENQSATIKYALLTLPRAMELQQAFSFSSQAFLSEEGVQKLLESTADRELWKRWLGEIEWKKLERNKQVFIVAMPTQRPDDLDGENQKLQDLLHCAYYSMLLASSPVSMWGEDECVAITGGGILREGKIHPKSIRQVSTYRPLLRPLYDRSQAFIEHFPRKFDQKWLEDWKAKYNQLVFLNKARSFHPAFDDFMESFQEARTVANPMTSIARFVEATETIIALPQKRGGRKEYAKRVLGLLQTECAGNPWLSWTDVELEQNLVRCYEIRIARNHGKGVNAVLPNLLGLPAGSSGISPAVEKLVYLSELTAKALASNVLSHHPCYELMRDRSALEKAWADGTFLSTGLKNLP